MAKTNQQKLLQNPTVNCLSAKEEHNNLRRYNKEKAMLMRAGQNPEKQLTLATKSKTSTKKITIRRDVGTTTSNEKPKSYKHAKRKQKRHQSDISTESDCSSNQTVGTNIPDQRKTQKKHSQISNNQGNKIYILLAGNNHQLILCLYTEEINRQQTTTVMIDNQQKMKVTIINKSTISD